MKKTAAAIIAAALVITLGGTTAFAFNRAGQSDSQNTVDRAAGMGYNQYNECTYCGETGHCYTDSNGDGVCDHRASHTTDAGTCYKYIHSTSDTGCPGDPHIIVTEPGITPDTGTDTDNKKRGKSYAQRGRCQPGDRSVR